MQSYEVVPVSSVQAHPENPRKGDVDRISESIRANGFYGAIVIQKSTRNVLAGNHRLIAAVAEGHSEIPAIVIDCDDQTARRILLADNRTNDLAGYDGAALAEIMQSLTQEAGSAEGLLGTGYEIGDLDILLDELSTPPISSRGNFGPELDHGNVNRTPQSFLAWADQRIPISADDIARLNALLESFVEAEGSKLGFLAHLIDDLHPAWGA